MKNRIIAVLIIAGVAGLILYWPQPPVRNPEEAGLSVSTSFYPLYFLTKEIIGSRGNVYNITPAGAEPHDYELSTRDRMQLETSDLIILNGGKFEPWGAKIASLMPPGKILEASEPLILNNDPHVWLDPVLFGKMAEEIAAKLTAVDPDGAEIYSANLAVLLGQIRLMDDSFRIGLSRCEQSDIITSHSAFSYLARRYGFNQHSIAGLSPDAEPGPQALAEVAKFAGSKGIKYIFFESLVSPKLAETVAREAGAQTLVLNPLEGLSDEELAGGKNFFTEMKINLINLKTAMLCR